MVGMSRMEAFLGHVWQDFFETGFTQKGREVGEAKFR
jgi:hypothetical protein